MRCVAVAKSLTLSGLSFLVPPKTGLDKTPSTIPPSLKTLLIPLLFIP